MIAVIGTTMCLSLHKMVVPSTNHKCTHWGEETKGGVSFAFLSQGGSIPGFKHVQVTFLFLFLQKVGDWRLLSREKFVEI